MSLWMTLYHVIWECEIEIARLPAEFTYSYVIVFVLQVMTVNF